MYVVHACTHYSQSSLDISIVIDIFDFYLHMNTCRKQDSSVPHTFFLCFVLERVQTHKSVIMKGAIMYDISSELLNGVRPGNRFEKKRIIPTGKWKRPHVRRYQTQNGFLLTTRFHPSFIYTKIIVITIYPIHACDLSTFLSITRTQNIYIFDRLVNDDH